jgi:hypothetical protein
MLSGVAAVVNPQGVAEALHLTTADARGVTETRAGLGGTYAALGGWALVSREPAADVAVGMTWLGAAAVRVATWRADRPPVSASYWAYLGLEVACGTVSLTSAVTRRRAGRRAGRRLPPAHQESPEERIRAARKIAPRYSCRAFTRPVSLSHRCLESR